jgi:hypothetical protein
MSTWDRAAGNSVALVPTGLAHGDRVGRQQPVDHPVEAGALADVDDLILPPLFDQPLDAVRVQRLVVQQGQDGQGER